MTARDRDGLIARIRHVGRLAAARDPSPSSEADADVAQLRALEGRIAHLEALVEGLQDSVHREITRQDRQIAELEHKTEPATLGKALSRDARERGL